jgi:hypothetical protein
VRKARCDDVQEAPYCEGRREGEDCGCDMHEGESVGLLTLGAGRVSQDDVGLEAPLLERLARIDVHR